MNTSSSYRGFEIEKGRVIKVDSPLNSTLSIKTHIGTFNKSTVSLLVIAKKISDLSYLFDHLICRV